MDRGRFRTIWFLWVLLVGFACEPGPEPLETASLALEESPEVKILAPSNYLYIPQDSPTTPVTLTFAVNHWSPFPTPSRKIQFYLDGVFAGEQGSTFPFTFNDVPMGVHTLSAVLFENGSPLAHESAQASTHVRITPDCVVDDDCLDANPCSFGECIATGFGESSCRWGVELDCCNNLFDCPYLTPYCADVTGDGLPQCVECIEDNECEDGNPCSLDTCQEGLCVNYPVANSCYLDSDCDDQNPCTQDSCNTAACSCTQTPIQGCCAADSQCDDENPCTQDRCIGNQCRHGPANLNLDCCIHDYECISASPCEIGVCELSGNSGICSSQPDPLKPQCCTWDQDCDPLSDKWMGRCTFDVAAGYNTCGYFLDPEWCETKDVTVQLNELMVNPEAAADAYGEWVELLNPSSDTVDISGWTLESQSDAPCTLSPNQPWPLAPGAHIVIGRVDDPLTNGQVSVDFSCGLTLSLNNAGGTVRLVSHDGPVDALTWTGEEILPGHSLTRISPYDTGEGNWVASIAPMDNLDFGTPGAPNLDTGSQEAPPICDDNIPCTLDLCAVDTPNRCLHLPMFECCINDEDCNDNDFCTNDSCGNDGRCTHQPDPQCCSIDVQCEDDNPCTNNRCINHHCRSGPTTPGQPCCLDTEHCDDSNPCTLDSCQDGVCTFQPIPHCCLFDSQCNDNIPCTQDRCLLDSHTCDNQPISSCCNSDAQCEAEKPDQYLCRPTRCISGRCRYGLPEPDCCLQAADCDDHDACTTDLCDTEANSCIHDPVGAGCCNTAPDCADDGNPCTASTCLDNLCIYQPVPGCCQAHFECDDSNPCTNDLCLNGQCRHHKQGLIGCCVNDSDCGSTNHPCTTNTCEDGTCTPIPVASCLIELEYLELFETASTPAHAGFHATTVSGQPVAASGWEISTNGALGPDRHLHYSPIPGTHTCIDTPRLKVLPGAEVVTLAFDLALELTGSAASLDTYVVRYTDPDNPQLIQSEFLPESTTLHRNITVETPGVGAKILWFRFCPGGADFTGSLSLDTFAGDKGTPPEIITNLAALNVQSGGETRRWIRARDADSSNASTPLAFYLEKAPGYVWLSDFSTDWYYDFQQMRLNIQPPNHTTPSLQEVVLRVYDRVLYDELTIQVQITDTPCASAEDCLVDLPCTAPACQFGTCYYPPVAPCCGNRELEATEECDDGNSASQDGCSSACTLEDNDWDGVVDYNDNCPTKQNSNQNDQDQDGIGDLCDLDLDGDSVANLEDNCPGIANGGQYDLDGDGQGDLCDADDDGDLIPDDEDNCPLTPNVEQTDTEFDGQGDACDGDDDNDNIPDDNDNCPLIPNPQQLDLDSDHIGDLCDSDADGDGALTPWDCDDLDPATYPRFLPDAIDTSNRWRFDTGTWLYKGVAWYAAAPLGNDELETYTQDNPAPLALPSPNRPVASGERIIAVHLETTNALWVLFDDFDYLVEGELQSDTVRASSDSLVWVQGSNANAEIVWWDNGLPHQLTDNTTLDYQPTISDSYVAWVSNGEIFVFDGESSFPVTQDSILDEQPTLWDNQLVWVRRSGPAGAGDLRLMNLDTGATLSLTNDSQEDREPRVGAYGVAWQRRNPFSDGFDLYFYDWDKVYALTTQGNDAIEDVVVADHFVAWIALKDQTRLLEVFDGARIEPVAMHLPEGSKLHAQGAELTYTDVTGPHHLEWKCVGEPDSDKDGSIAVEVGGDDCDDNNPQVYPIRLVINLTQGAVLDPSPPFMHDGGVVWSASDGHDREIFHFDGKSVLQLTHNSVEDTNPRTHSHRIVWEREEGDTTSIMFFDGYVLKALPSSEGGHHPQVWGPYVTWLSGSSGLYQIWLWNEELQQASQVTTTPISDTDYRLAGGVIAWATHAGDSQIRTLNLTTQNTESFGNVLLKDTSPRPFSDSIAWLSSGQNGEVWLRQNGTALPLTINLETESNLELWNGVATWQSDSPTSGDIVIRWPDGTIEKPTAGVSFEHSPVFQDNILAWIAGTGEEAELVVLDGSTLDRVTEDDIEDRSPTTHHGEVAWLHGNDVYLWKNACGEDLDNDGILNEVDNCPYLYNPNNTDFDGDTLGDTCDPDDDDDGIFDPMDNCPSLYNPSQSDIDQDQTGDSCDPDADGDGFLSLAFGGDDCNDLDSSIYPVWVPMVISGSATQNSEADIGPDGIVWSGKMGMWKQIYHYKDNVLYRLTQTLSNNQRPQAAGGLIVWENGDGDDREILLYDGSSAIPLTNNAVADRSPRTDGNSVVWYAHDGNDYEVFRYKDNSTLQVTVNGKNDYHPRVSGESIAWRGFDGNDYEVYLRTDGVLYNISNNDFDDGVPELQGDFVTWSSFDGVDYEIALWRDGDVSTLTHNSLDDLDPITDSGKIVWRRFDGHDYEIAMYTGVVATQLTDDDRDKGPPDLHNGRVVWAARDGLNDWEIFTYKAGSIVQVTDNLTQDVSPVVWNDTIAWSCGDAMCAAVAQCGAQPSTEDP